PYPYGIALDATLQNGLFTQLPGYVCLLLWQHYFLNARESSSAAAGAKSVLFLLVLSNAFIVPVAILFAAVTCISDIAQGGRNSSAVINSVKLYAQLMLLPVAAAAFWYVPLLLHSEYLVTMTLPSMSFHELVIAGIVPFGLTLVALVTSSVRE